MKKQDPREVSAKVASLILEKKYEEAFPLVEWFFDHTEHPSPLSGVRLSFCLSDWAEIAHNHPPAMKALCKKRDDALEAAKKEKSVARFRDFQSICFYLEQTKTAIKEFKTLLKNDPEFAKKVFFTVESDLVNHKEWKVSSSLIPDPKEVLKKIEKRYTNCSDWCDADSENLREDYFNLLVVLKKSDRMKEYEETFQAVKEILSKADMKKYLAELEKSLEE